MSLTLLLYIGEHLVDQTVLSHSAMLDQTMREAYLQEAVNNMLEKWKDLIAEKQLNPEFYINSVRLDR